MSRTSSGAVQKTALAAAIASSFIIISLRRRWRRLEHNSEPSQRGPSISSYEALIGSTPLVKLTKLSGLLGKGREIYVKMECMNPGGTGKDRAALRMIQDAERCGALPPPLDPSIPLQQSRATTTYDDNDTSSHKDEGENGEDSSKPNVAIDESISLAIARSQTGGIVVEGTSGSTGISIASLCAVRGHAAIVVMPDDQAKEKRALLNCLGAVVHVVPNAAISNPNQYVNVARRIADRINDRCNSARIKAAFTNQFENLSNYSVHLEWTGPELWSQAMGKLDAFVMSSGTGGTISGVGRYLKSRSPFVRVVLVDPPGSALYSKVKYGVAYASEQSERALKRHRYDTLAEGIGLDRVTANFAMGCDTCAIDDAIQISDQEAVDMAHWLLREEGIFVGSSSAMNVAGAVRVASSMPPDSRTVTVICDGGQRHVSRFWNKKFITEWGCSWPVSGGNRRLPDCIESIVS
mmetsp:Transcript_13259/g.29315  ORF Transcript_13259/g.29315 Transcript_13259/m.29315 type:complete len:465 (+) Transcript_13259:96-1490(+)